MRTTVAVLVAAVVTLVHPPVGRADPGLPATARDLHQLADRATRTALGRLTERGIHDPIDRSSVGFYGPAGFGYAGLRAAARSGDGALLERAVAAVLFSVRNRHTTPFDLWLTAKSYAWAQQHLRDEPRWMAVAPVVEGYLAAPPPIDSLGHGHSELWASNLRYNNWKLVEVAAHAASARAGVALWGADSVSRIRRISGLAVAAARGPAVSSWAAAPWVLSDPSNHPAAYAVLSSVLLRETERRAPSWLSPALKRVSRGLDRYVLSIAAPNGTVAWNSRSMRLSWTLAAAMVVGLDEGGIDGRGLAASAWEHLRRDYGLRRDGYLAIAPILRASDDATGADAYANMVIYGGLTAVLLNDAADALEASSRPLQGQAPSARRDGSFVDAAGAGIMSQRQGDVWWGASVRPSRADQRFQPGLHAVQIRSGGRWREVLPAVPKSTGPGPMWPAPRGCRWRHVAGHRLRCGTSTMRVGIDARARRVVLRLRVRPRERVRGTVFVSEPVAGRRQIRWTGGSLRTSGDARVRTDQRMCSSVTHAAIQRIDYAFRADRRGRATVSVGR